MSANASPANASVNSLAGGRLIDEPEIDLIALLERCLGDTALAARLLERLGDRLLPAVIEVETCLSAANRAQAAARVHSLKGEAGSLAAEKLHRAAAALEKHLKLTPQVDSPEVDLLAGELRRAAEVTRDALPPLINALTSSNRSAN